MLLLGSVVFALSGHVHSEQVAIELEAGVGVPNYDCGVVDTEKQLVVGTGATPLLQALVRRKLQHLHRVPIWILEVERRNARRVLVPVRKALWSRRSMFHLVLS